MVIRPYKDGDLERVLEVTVLAFDGVSIDQNTELKYGRIGKRSWKDRKRWNIEGDIRANPSGVLVAEFDGKVVGYITTRLNQRSKIGWIPNLAVDPAYHKKGIGRKLIDEALRYFRDNGMELAKIETLEQNDVCLKFYPGLGFDEVARQVYYVMKLE